MGILQVSKILHVALRFGGRLVSNTPPPIFCYNLHKNTFKYLLSEKMFLFVILFKKSFLRLRHAACIWGTVIGRQLKKINAITTNISNEH